MTQIESMDKAVDGLVCTPMWEVDQLRKLLVETQNLPPAGNADGTVGQRDWDIALRIVQAAEQLQLALNHWEELARERRGPPESA